MASWTTNAAWIGASVGYLIGYAVGRLQGGKKPNSAIQGQKLQEAFEHVAEMFDIARIWTAGLGPLEGQEREDQRNKLQAGWFTARDKLMKTQVWWPDELGKPVMDFQVAILKLNFRPLSDEEMRMLDGRYRQLVQLFKRHLN